MPYTEAFTLESQRYSSSVPVGLGREATQDVMFEGYHIQKGDYVSRKDSLDMIIALLRRRLRCGLNTGYKLVRQFTLPASSQEEVEKP